MAGGVFRNQLLFLKYYHLFSSSAILYNQNELRTRTAKAGKNNRKEQKNNQDNIICPVYSFNTFNCKTAFDGIRNNVTPALLPRLMYNIHLPTK